MRIDRDGLDRGSFLDRSGGSDNPILISHLYARLRLDQNCAGYTDTNSDVYVRSVQGMLLHGYMDTGTDEYARLRLDQVLGGYADTLTDQAVRLRIAHNLKYGGDARTAWGRIQIDRAGLDRRFTRWTGRGTKSDIVPTLYPFPRNVAAYVVSEANLYAWMRLDATLRSYADTLTDQAARLRIDAILSAYPDTNSDLYALVRFVTTWTLTYAGTLAIGDTICIDGEDFTVKNDGANDIANFSGEFPSIFPGTNWVVYTDSGGSRTIQLVVSKKDRMV